MIGRKKQTDFPDPVPVVTTKLRRALAMWIDWTWWVLSSQSGEDHIAARMQDAVRGRGLRRSCRACSEG